MIKLQGREILLWQQNIFSQRKMGMKTEMRSVGNSKEVHITRREKAESSLKRHKPS